MKKTLTALAALAIFAACLTSASAPGSVTDPLVSKNYVDGEFTPETVEKLSEEGASALERLFSDYAADPEEEGTVYDFASGFSPLELSEGGKVKLRFGSSVILSEGSARLSVKKGTVICIADAAEITGDAELKTGLRYFLCEDTLASVTATGDITVLVNGYFAADGEKPGESEMRYSDVAEKNWFYQYVKFVVENGLYYDIDGDRFRPNEEATRATLVYALWSAAGRPDTEGEAAFSDVGDEWYTRAVVWATSTGVVKGYDDGTFRPDGNVTREQIAALIHRYAKYLGREEGETGNLDVFGDADKVGKWASADVEWAVGNEVIRGNDKKLLNPKGTATRAEVAAILQRVLEK